MSVSSDIVLANAARILGDEANIHWPASILLSWLNEAQHQIATEVPTSSTAISTVTCVAGARQSLADTGIQVLSLDGLRAVDKSGLDRESPGWQNSTASDTTTMWMPSTTNPREFYTYPPRLGGTIDGVEHSILPTTVTLGDNITLPDRYSEALTDYLVYRGLSEDTDLAEPARAEHFFGLYNSRAGIT